MISVRQVLIIWLCRNVRIARLSIFHFFDYGTGYRIDIQGNLEYRTGYGIDSKGNLEYGRGDGIDNKGNLEDGRGTGDGIDVQKDLEYKGRIRPRF